MFALVVKFDLFDVDKAAAFDQLVAETVKSITENEPGTLVYATNTVDGEPLSRIFYEVYRDRDAFEEHERQPHTRRFLDKRRGSSSLARCRASGGGVGATGSDRACRRRIWTSPLRRLSTSRIVLAQIEGFRIYSESSADCLDHPWLVIP
jgi:quinol monooxygenase YgiN